MALQRILLSILVGAYPALFFVSNNWYAFSARQNAVLIACVTTVSAAVLLVSTTIFEQLASRVLEERKAAGFIGHLVDGFHAATSLLLCFFLLRSTLLSLGVSPIFLLLAVSAAVVLGARSAYAGRARLLTRVFVALVALSLGQWVFNHLEVQSIIDGDAWFRTGSENSAGFEFSQRPNVYFIVAESYPSRAALEQIFTFDNTPFYEELESRGFLLQHDFFSNYHATITSLSSTFSMAHHYYASEIGILDSFYGRDVISAKVNNAVVDVFDNNGYAIEFIHEINYQLRQGAPLDYYWPPVSNFAALKAFLGEEVKLGWLTSWEDERSEFTFEEVIDQRLESIASRRRPTFTYIYSSSPGHSPSAISQLDRELASEVLFAFRSEHPEAIRGANSQLLEIIDRILEVDPNAIIALSGDHGAWAYRNRLGADGEELPGSLIALDRLGILFAMRIPGYGVDANEGRPKTLVNLFPYIFEQLSDGAAVEGKSPADDGFLKNEGVVVLAVEDGRILSEPIALDQHRAGRYKKLGFR